MSQQDIAAIRALIEARIAALHRGDAAAANAILAEDIVAYEMAPPLAVTGAAARDDAATQAWLDSLDGSLRIESRGLEIAASGDTGFAYGFHRVTARQGGQEIDFWHRSTFCFRKRGGQWRMVHAHSSVPFRPEEGFRAAMDLLP